MVKRILAVAALSVLSATPAMAGPLAVLHLPSLGTTTGGLVSAGETAINIIAAGRIENAFPILERIPLFHAPGTPGSALPGLPRLMK